MASRNRLTLHLDEWRAQFAAEPAALGAGAELPIQSAAEQAAQALASAYPTGPTGNLKAGVRVVEPPAPSAAVAAAIVSSSAPHAHLYEYGTIYARSNPTFFPITDRYGVVAWRDVDRMVRSRGYSVSGTPDTPGE